MAAFVLTSGMVAGATGGRVAAGPADAVFSGVSIDSRTSRPGDLFIALHGPNFDGHAFVGAAHAAGVAGVLVSREPAGGPAGAVIVVEDTLAALQSLGRAVRRRSGARVVAITGSAGKTTTKEAAAAILGARYRVFRNAGNLNNHVGLPLSLVELRHGPEVAVVELGMNHAGEIRALVGIAEPEVRVWTNVGDAHIGFFGSRDAIAAAKAEILEAAAPETLVVANADDPLVMRHVDRFAGRRLTFGEAGDAGVRALAVRDYGFDGTTAVVATPAGRLHLTVPLAGHAQLMNVLAAAAVAVEFGVPGEAIEARVRALEPVARRGVVRRLARGIRVVDDSYNASPAAVAAMLGALARTPAEGRRLAVLGEMLELGDQSAAHHEASGRLVASLGLDALVAVGGEAADALAAGAARAGLPAARIHRFADSEAAASGLGALIEAGDLILVKGSRGARMDRVADRLEAEG